MTSEADAIMIASVAQLIVRNLEDELVDALKARANQFGRSAEAEHREILRAALLSPAAGKSLWDWLALIPSGEVEDDEFERQGDLPRDIEL